jgi:DNA-binding IclR family transcriptional regulator
MDETSSFRMVFGNTPIVKVIDFFLDNREFDYSLTDIAKNSDIGWSTLHLFWKDLVKLGIVVKTRRIGRAELYKLNLKSLLVQKLIELDKSISNKLINEQLKIKN